MLFRNKAKIQIYVKNLTGQKLRELEQTAEDDVDLARKLFLAIFKEDIITDLSRCAALKLKEKRYSTHST